MFNFPPSVVQDLLFGHVAMRSAWICLGLVDTYLVRQTGVRLLFHFLAWQAQSCILLQLTETLLCPGLRPCWLAPKNHLQLCSPQNQRQQQPHVLTYNLSHGRMQPAGPSRLPASACIEQASSNATAHFALPVAWEPYPVKTTLRGPKGIAPNSFKAAFICTTPHSL